MNKNTLNIQKKALPLSKLSKMKIERNQTFCPD